MDKDGTELTTEATMELQPDGKILLYYEETKLTGMEGTTTTFEIQGGRVILRRSGTTNSQMVFEEGVQHTSLYSTPYGELTMDIHTSHLRHNLSERGGVMDIRYSISVEHALTGKNRFCIRVRPRHCVD